MKDTIYREDVIKAVAQDLMYKACIQSEYASDELSDWIEVAKVILEEVPSADRQQGEWIPSDTDGFVCSVCKNGYRNQPTLMGRPMFEYCPVCGARMKGADDE